MTRQRNYGCISLTGDYIGRLWVEYAVSNKLNYEVLNLMFNIYNIHNTYTKLKTVWEDQVIKTTGINNASVKFRPTIYMYYNNIYGRSIFHRPCIVTTNLYIYDMYMYVPIGHT